jgi:acyl-CoA dehydrogenase
MMEELAREKTAVGVAAVNSWRDHWTQSLTDERELLKLQIQNTQFKLAECTTQMQIHQAFFGSLYWVISGS